MTTDIQITVAQQDGASRTLAVTVPAERVAAAEAEAARRYGRSARVPGFRKGHVPPQVVRRRFGDAIRQNALEQLLRESWDRVRADQGLRPVGEPRVRITRYEEGADLAFEIHVDVQPELKLDRLGGFTLRRAVAPVTDEAIESQLLALREQRAVWVPAEGRAKPGDLVEATIVNLDAGENPGEPVRFVIGQGRAAPDLEAQVMELDPGQGWEGAIRFPDDHPDEAKRGQSRRLRVTLHEVKRQQLPELDDAFERAADARVRAELVDHIAAANNVAVPPSLLDRALHAYTHSYGVPEPQHARFAAEFRPVAEAQVRRDLILEAVADAAGLRATPAELDARLAAIAARRGEAPGQVRAALEKAGRLRELERAITDEKVFAHLLGQSTVEPAIAAR
jgi:trigger factor